MTTKVKICGLKTEAALEAALAGGADYVGFVFYPPSPRNITVEAAADLARRIVGRADVVALLVDPDDGLLDAVWTALAPDIFQLHGSESPDRVAEIRRKFGTRVMKAIRVSSREDAETALSYAGIADLILFDAKVDERRAGALPGGNGTLFDWTAIDEVKARVSYILSGGLNPDNVSAAIEATGAVAVDVSSGVEVRPGEKDVNLIARFIAIAKSAPATRIVS